MRRSQPLGLIVAVAIALVGLFLLNRGNGHAERVVARDAATGAATTGSPLDKALSAAQRAQFEHAVSTLSLVAFADALPVARGKALAAKACADLDASVPLLRALRGTCKPTVAVREASMRLRRDCASGKPTCESSTRRRARATRRIAAADRAYAHAVRAAVPKGVCRDALAPTHKLLAAELGYAGAFDQMADAMDDDTDDAMDAAHKAAGKFDDVITDSLVWHRTREMAEACNLEPWAFETVR